MNNKPWQLVYFSMTNLHTLIILFFVSLFIPILTSLMVMEPSHLTISRSRTLSPMETTGHEQRLLRSQRLMLEENNRHSSTSSTHSSTTITTTTTEPTTDFVTTATSTSTTDNFLPHIPLQTNIQERRDTGRPPKYNDKIQPSSNNSLIFDNLNTPATISILFSVGTILVIVASVGALGIRRSVRRVPPKSAEKCADLIDRFIALEKSPTWIARDIVQIPGVSTYDASLAQALNVTINDIQNLRAQANIRNISTTTDHQVSNVPPPNVRYMATLSSSRQSLTGSWASKNLIRSPQVNIVLARTAPAPPEFSVNEVIQLRRRFSVNEVYYHNDQPIVSHRQSNMSASCYDQQYQSQLTFSSGTARPKSTNVVKIGQSLGIIVTAYSGHPLSLKRNRKSLCTFDGNLQLHGRQRSNSIPSEMIRYFAYKALSQHNANINQAIMPRSVSALSDATILSIDETCPPTYDSEGNVIVVPAYQRVAHHPIDWYNPVNHANSPFSDAVTDESVQVKKSPAAMRISYNQPEQQPRYSQGRPLFFQSKKNDTIISTNDQHDTFQVIGRSIVQDVPSSLRRRRSLLVNSVSFLPTLNNRSMPDPTHTSQVTASHVYTPARSAYLLNDPELTNSPRTCESACISIESQVTIITESIIDIDTDLHNDFSM